MGFFDSIKEKLATPLQVAAGIQSTVTTVAAGAAEVKGRIDLINADLDHNGKTQVQDIKESGGKIINRVFGDAALKHPAPGENEEQKAARLKLLAEEKTTAKLLVKTKEEWTEEYRYYEVEGKVLYALVTGFAKALLTKAPTGEVA